MPGQESHFEAQDEDPKSRRQKEIEATKKLLEKANDLLAEVDETDIMKGTEPRRHYPTFDAVEVKTGPLLGVGGFCVVWEVKDFNLKVPNVVQVMHDKTDDAGAKVTDESPEAPVDKEVEQPRSDAKHLSEDTVGTHLIDDGNFHMPRRFVEDDDAHYDVRSARYMMTKLVQRNGSARYAVKRLQRDLSELERARAMIDLALEVKYLSVLWHPNIVKMRGYASGSLLDPKFFIVMDRLYEILDARFMSWVEVKNKNRGGLFGRGANKERLKELLVERLTVAYDLSAAFWYMHQHGLVYRDIKIENIGFDIRGDVKVFDFGLSKGLSASLKAKDKAGREVYGYNLTPRTGSLPYMAPEIVECLPYDTKCDVFSFAMLLWQLMSLKAAFPGISRGQYLQRVVRNKERPQLFGKCWPPLTRLAIKEAWDHDPQKRPDMKRVAALVRGDLNELSDDPEIQDRTAHMRERSAHSRRFLSSSRSGLINGSKHSMRDIKAF